MDGVTLLRQARRAGLRVGTDGERLIIEGPRRLESVAEALLAQKRTVLEALADENDREVAWRITAMRQQVPAAGAIPLLLARSGVRFLMGTCCSCGDPLIKAERYRCRACVEAVVAVLAVKP